MTRILTLTTTPRLTAALLACVMTVSLMFPALAVADDATWAWVSVEIYDLEPGKTPTLVVLAQLAEEVALPAETSLAIPKTSALSWAGEIYGGDPANDPTLDVTIEEFDEYNLVHFTLQDSPRVQLELTTPEGALGGSPDAITIDLQWTASAAAERARIGVGVPFSNLLENTSEETTVQVRSSDLLYSAETIPVAAGDTLRFVGTMVAGTAPELTEMMSTPPADEPADETQDASDTVDAPATAETDTEGALDPALATDTPAEDDGGIDSTTLLLGALLLAFATVVGILVFRLRAERSA